MGYETLLVKADVAGLVGKNSQLATAGGETGKVGHSVLAGCHGFAGAFSWLNENDTFLLKEIDAKDTEPGGLVSTVSMAIQASAADSINLIRINDSIAKCGGEKWSPIAVTSTTGEKFDAYTAHTGVGNYPAVIQVHKVDNVMFATLVFFAPPTGDPTAVPTTVTSGTIPGDVFAAAERRQEIV